MGFSFRTFVYEELRGLSHASLGKKLQYACFAAVVLLIYLSLILVVASTQEMLAQQRNEGNEAVAGDSIKIPLRFDVILGD